MKYKLAENVFFKKISDDQVNILLADNDNFIFKLNKIAAQIFILIADKKMDRTEVRAEVVKLTSKSDSEIDKFLTEFFKQMIENKFLVEG